MVELLLFLHISLAVIWVGGGLMMQFFGVRASMSGEPARMAMLGEDIEWIANRVFIPSSLLAFVTGILLVVESDFYGFGDDWIVIGLALYTTTFFAGLLFSGRSRVASGSSRKPARRPWEQRERCGSSCWLDSTSSCCSP